MSEFDYLAKLARQGRLSRRAFIGRAIALGASAAITGSLAEKAFAQTPVKGGILKAGLRGGASSDSLDPALISSQLPINFAKTWGEFLARMTPDAKLENLIAEEFGASDQGTTWTIRIRDGIEFHNGKTVTAEDVAATLQRHSDPETQSGAYGILKNITGIRADGREVIVTLATPDVDFPYLMTDYHLIIQPNGGFDDPTAGISAGPYKVAVNEPGIRHGGEKFQNYWQADQLGHADQVEIIVINDTTARVAALQSGQVHMIDGIEPKVVDLVKRLPGVTVETATGKSVNVFNIFCDTAPFSDNNMRLALKLAMDREQMLEHIQHGYGEIGNDFPINSAYPLFPDDIPQREFDPDQAQHYYKQSGHDGPIVLRTSEVAFPGAVDAAMLYQQMCAKAGIPVEIRREPNDGYFSEVWNKQPFSLSEWSGRATQDQMYSTAYISTSEWNDTRFSDEKFDNLIMAARGEFDETKRKQMYHDAAMILHETGGLIAPFFNQWINGVASDKVGGWVEDGNDDMSNGYAFARCWLKA